MAGRATWVKLGALLRARREDGLGYSKLARFARDRGIGERTAWNLENAARSRYAAGTLLLADSAYGLAPGSILAFLAGGELAEIPDAGLLDGLSAEDQQAVRDFATALRLLAQQHQRAGQRQWRNG